jgi:uncharacterized repeat protein (TIGR02543 family)
MGTGTAWGWSYTVYCVPKAIWGADWTEGSNIVKVLWKTENNSKEFLQQMSKTSYTYEGEYIYEYTIYDLSAEGADKLEYQRYSSEDKYEAFHTVFGSYWGHDGFENKIFRGEWENDNPIMRTFGRDITFYAVPESMDGSKWDEGSHTLYADIKYGDSDWKKVQMTKSAYDYNGNPIYTCTTLIPYDVIKQIKFYYNDGSDHDLYDCNPGTQYGTNDLDGKILLGWNGSHNWVSYGRDVTIYTIPDYLFKDKGTPYDESIHYPAVCIQMGTGSTWNTVNMTKTSYTYATYPIYKATILIDQNKFWEFQIKYFNKSGDTQVDLYQFNQSEPKTEYAPSYIDDKLYHGWNGASHDFFSYRYDVALDMQSGGGGSTSIIAIDGSAMPSATMPGRDGYAFGGYWTETNGGGTQYYNSDGSSTRNWDSRTITTLYAHWTPEPYTVTLEGMEADSDDPILVNVTYDAVLPSLETKHTKAHYDLRGYWAASDDEGEDLTEQLIDANGNWIPGVTGYTGNDGEGHPIWVHDNSISLFAQWTEHPYTITTSVSPAGAGTLSCGSSVTAKWVTPSDLITATANPAWKFKEWQFSKTGENDYDVYVSDNETYSSTDATIGIKAQRNGTLTAVFEPRFCLVGSIWDDTGNGGMPGWEDYTADFTVNSYTDLNTMNLTCVRSLDPNTTYKFEVHDKVKGQNFGYSEASTFIADRSLLFNTQNNDVLLRVNGYGPCTFTISALTSGDLYPTVSVAIPPSHQLKLEWAYVRINGDWYKTSDAVGGTVSAQTTESGHHFTIHNDEYVAHGGDITYTATPATGYTFEGWYNNNYNIRFSTTNPYTSSNIQTTEKVEAKFVEKATAVTLSNDGHGHVEIDGEMVSNTTVGVTTTRELTAVPNEGYKFDSWTIVSGSDITLSSTSTNPTTLSGNGAGAASGQEVRANFVERWALSAQSEGWGSAEFSIANVSIVAGKAIGYVDIALPANTDMQFKMVDKQTGDDYKSGSDRVYYMTNGNSHNWSFATDKIWNCGITTAGAGTYRFTWNITDKKMTVTYPNFVIYRTGDKAEDPRAQNTDVESYAGGTISEAIEFRMKVQTIDQWYSLSLPFAVSSVKVWDDEDGAYYDIVPYYRTGGKFYTGHYIIRKPETVTNYAIETFEERWVDPENRGVLPEKNIPYIIQWHDPYFLGKYISFFGSTNQAIPSDFNAGGAPSADDVVNVFGNNTMHSGTVRDAYLLDKDYGPSGAWLREEIGTDRTILPFECFIRASQQGTARYRIIRRGMEIDTPTALEQISNHQSPMTIRVYTITGVLIGEYNDCSFQDAAHRIATDHNEGIYILRSEKESVKLMIGRK